MTQGFPLLAATVLLTVLAAPRPCTGDVVFSLDLPLGDEAALRAVVEGYGGTVQGGTFGAEGWTTTSREDLIVVPLPAGLEAQEGAAWISFKNPEVDLSTDWFEQWVILSLDGRGDPYRSTPAGQAGLQSIYRGYNPDDPSRSYRLVGYFNLFDPICTDWRNCTGEAGTSPGWITGDDTVFSIRHDWAGCADALTFTGRGTTTRPVNLCATSAAGVIDADALFLLVNACGGSDVDACGAWDGPAEMRGGPVGITYVSAGIEIYGEAPAEEEAAAETIEEADAAEAPESADVADVPDRPPDAPADSADAPIDAAGDPLLDGQADAPPATEASSGCACAILR